MSAGRIAHRADQSSPAIAIRCRASGNVGAPRPRRRAAFAEHSLSTWRRCTSVFHVPSMGSGTCRLCGAGDWRGSGDSTASRPDPHRGWDTWGRTAPGDDSADEPGIWGCHGERASSCTASGRGASGESRAPACRSGSWWRGMSTWLGAHVPRPLSLFLLTASHAW
jgi:hypothetical protein